jgi:hypothetical protein
LRLSLNACASENKSKISYIELQNYILTKNRT